MRASSASLFAHTARVDADRIAKGQSSLHEDELDAEELLQEAAAIEPSALRYIELAEFLATRRGKDDEVHRVLRLARRLAPRHPVIARWLPKD
jgi:hypothetical protein